MAVFDVRHVDRGDRRVVAESAGQHVADRVVHASLHEGGADAVRGRAIDLAFDDRRIDDRAAIVDGDVVENPWDEGFAIDFDDGDVQLRRVGQREVAVLLYFVGNFEGRAPDVAAVQRDVVQLGRKNGAIHVHDVGESPVVDGLAIRFRAKLGALLPAPNSMSSSFVSRTKAAEALHFGFEFLRSAVYRGKTGYSELAGVGAGHSGVHVALGIEAGANRDQVGMNIENVGDDLRRGGFVSLALRAGTDGDDDFAVDIELAVGALRVAGKRRVGIDDLRLAEIVGAGVERGADADSDQTALLARVGLLFLPVVPADQFLSRPRASLDSCRSRRRSRWAWCRGILPGECNCASAFRRRGCPVRARRYRQRARGTRDAACASIRDSGRRDTCW